MTVDSIKLRERKQKLPSVWKVTYKFSRYFVWANIRNYKMFLFSLIIPLLMLFAFWVTNAEVEGEEYTLLEYMFPAIVMFGVMMSGQAHAIRICSWKEKGVFKRLAATPVPLLFLFISIATTQVIIGILQGLFVLAFGIIATGVSINASGILLAICIMVFTSMVFISFGQFLAALIKRLEIASFAYFFFIMPIFFLACFPTHMLPDLINKITPWLPTTMAIELVGHLLATAKLPEEFLFQLFGLFGYLILFNLGSIRLIKFFRI